jgi:short-subunit dehydrogenase
MSEKIAIKNNDLIVFITGATSGIGKSLALQYAAEGAILGLVGRRLELLTKIKSKIKTPCDIYAIDVTDQKALQKASIRVRCVCCDRIVSKNRLLAHMKTNLCLRTQNNENYINDRLNGVTTVKEE